MPHSLSERQNSLVPLCVDLDGTILKTDVLLEHACELLKQRPWYLFWFAMWLLKGRAYFKHQLANSATLDVATLPYCEELIDFLKSERARGRMLVLTTAASQRAAEEIATHLGIFDRVIASDETLNLKGRAKLERLQEIFGETGFGYAGNASVDLDIWKHAAEVVVVNARSSVVNKASRFATTPRVFQRKGNRIRSVLRAARIHQWVKNLLLFVPLILAHRITDTNALLKSTLGFLCFSLCASSVYIVNDILDLKADRAHPLKRNRPFAAGDLSIATGLILVPLLLVPSFAMAGILSGSFFVILGLYYCLTLGYSLYLKRVALLDVSTLSLLYTIRLFAGSALTEVTISQWLLAFSMFLFFSLAMVKRSSELYNAKNRQQSLAHGRGYLVSDRQQLATLGTASGYCAVLVFALYINSSAVVALYSHPNRLWLVCPLIFYWISRLWLLAHRGEINEDPVVFAFTDRVSYINGALVAVFFLSAI